MTTREQALDYSERLSTNYECWCFSDVTRSQAVELVAEALRDSGAENARLRKALEEYAVGWEDEAVFRGGKNWIGHQGPDTAIDAIADSPAAQPTPEDKPAREWRWRARETFGQPTPVEAEVERSIKLLREAHPAADWRKQWRTTAGPWNDAPTQETKK